MARKRRDLSDADWGIGDRPQPERLPARVASEPAAVAPRGARAPDKLDLSKLDREARAYVELAKAPETVRAYNYHWTAFKRWCGLRGVRHLPADGHDVANYMAYRSQHGVPANEDENATAEPWRPVTVAQALAAIGLMHEFHGLDSPRGRIAVKTAWEGIRRAHGVDSERQVAPLTPADLLAASSALDDGTLVGKRDRAILLLGFATAFRRGELAALEVRDLKWAPKGVEVSLRRHYSGNKIVAGSKSNQARRRREDMLVHFGQREETCPVRALRAWLEAAGVTEGRVFRAVQGAVALEAGLGPQGIALAVKAAAVRLGLDPSAYSGHSLRSGFATAAAKAGKAPWVIAGRTRHVSLDTLRIYIRDFDEEDPVEGLL